MESGQFGALVRGLVIIRTIARNPYVQRSVTRILTWFVRATQRFPLPIARRIGRALGVIGYAVMPGRRRIARANIDAAFGDSLSAREKRRIIRESFQNVGILAMEFAFIPKIGSRQLVRLSGLENLDLSRACLFVSAHTANWEWIAPAVRSLGYPVAEVVSEYDHSPRGELIDSVRQSNGVITVSKSAATNVLLRLMSEGTHVGILADQSARRSRVPTTFFGRPCWTTAGPAVLALRKRVPVHISMMRREADGNYALELSPRLDFAPTGNFRADVAALTQRIQDVIEQHVRRYPGQWLWIHKRWKERPDVKARWGQHTASSSDIESGAA
jgi:KDO2-lipid IV(A) lauroyltransferase